MKIKTALILCAGFGKRLNPVTLKIPKPLIEIKKVSMLEHCINLIINLGVEKICLNTFYLGNQISEFIKEKNFPLEIKIINDGKEILDTGGGVLNMINTYHENDYLIFNPDTIWNNDYTSEIKDMEQLYFKKNLNNILLVSQKKFSFDKRFKGDFELMNNLLNRKNKKDYIYIGCQILKKELFKDLVIKSFSISKIWEKLLNKNQLNGFESTNKFNHLTDLEIFKKLKDH